MVFEGGSMSNDKLLNRVSNFVSGSNFNKSFPKKKYKNELKKIAAFKL